MKQSAILGLQAKNESYLFVAFFTPCLAAVGLTTGLVMVCCRTDVEQITNEALVLDMGEYDIPSLANAVSSKTTAKRLRRVSITQRMAHLKVFQILPPELIKRAYFFRNKLALKEDATCTDLPFFDAPGAVCMLVYMYGCPYNLL